MPVRMPKGKKCAFVYDLHVDGACLWFGGGFAATPLPTTVSRGVFGPREGLPRLLKLLKKMEIKCTFGIPGHTAETFNEECKKIVEDGHEVIYHGYIHENVTKLTKEQEEAVMKRGVESLKKSLGVTPMGYAQHSPDVSVNTAELIEKFNFAHCMTSMESEFHPFRMRVGDKVSMDGPIQWGRKTKVVEIPFSWYLDDWPQFDYIYGVQTGFKEPKNVFESYKAFFDYMYNNEQGGVMRLVNHPQVVGHAHIIPHLEALLKYVKSHNDVWIATCLDVAKAFED
jgi:peptidoglycan/xylan/chitin deacetylase (PgdA/CDA1 family)